MPYMCKTNVIYIEPQSLNDYTSYEKYINLSVVPELMIQSD